MSSSKKKSNKEEEFVNTGKERWLNVRRQWLTVTNTKPSTSGEVRARDIDPEDVIDRIFSQNGDGTLAVPVPLGQMVDILIDFWEADGLYD
jgi:hypothetical protein